ncbi:MAG TPA: molybdopterin-dependent oxidoreductase [Rectinemataceae bacterium]|nr:molybdopterin-dependent oxidoreductase [Rectinemataceae bacterium]
MRLPVFCGKDCGGGACPLIAVLDGGRVTRIEHNGAAGTHITGCRRGFGLARSHYAADRLRMPLIRTGDRGSGSFREAGWDEALGLVAQGLADVRDRWGHESVLNLSSAGSLGALHSTPALTSRFLDCFGGRTSLQGSYSNGAARFVLPYLLGPDWRRNSGFDPATLRQAGMIVLWGANVLETRMGAELPSRLLEARRRGARIVAIDPRRTQTVERASTQWLPIRPGTDAALMLALLHVLVTEGLVDRGFVAERAVGFERIEAYVLGAEDGLARDPPWASGICGVAEAEIRDLARAWALTKPTMLIPGYSIQRVEAGEESYRLTVALQLATGNFGARGGSTGSMNNCLPLPRVGKIDPRSRPGGAAVPQLRWPDAILEGRSGGYASDIHAAYVAGSNLANQGADLAKSARAFGRLDFAVCHEMFLTPTARLCDVVLPAASPLEKEDIGLPWAGNYLLYKPRVAASEGQARSDYDIFAELAWRMGFGPVFTEGRSAAEWIESFIAESEVPDPEEFKSLGIYLGPEQERVGLEDFARDPRGHPLATASGKVELASEAYARDTGGSAIPKWRGRAPEPRLPLSLVSPKIGAATHSQGRDPSGKEATGAQSLEINALDARERGISDGAMVRVFNHAGSTRVRARLTEGIMRGVVSLPEGVWSALDGSGEDRTGSPNVLTTTMGGGPSVSAVMHGIGVEVERMPE